MSIPKYTHGCGTITAQDGSGNKEVVVAAGDVAEIYTIGYNGWREGDIQLMM